MGSDVTFADIGIDGGTFPEGGRAADRATRAEAAGLLARAFRGEPHFVDLFPDEHTRMRVLPHVFAALLRDASRHGRIEVARREGEPVGVAVWFPPNAMPPSVRRNLRVLPDIGRVLLAAPRSMRRLVQFSAGVSRHRPPQPYWYLAAVGVDPEFQRQGVATHLLAAVLAEAEAAREDCYLETHTPRNVEWYRRLGFEVREAEVAFTPGGPPNWTMIRRGDRNDS